MKIPSISVEGKVAVITGGSQGIGNGLAKGFAKVGASVVLVARGVDLLNDAAQEIESEDGKVLAVPTDITESAQVSQLVTQTMEAFGRIDVLINCAGGAGADRFIHVLDMEEATWDRVHNLNLRAVYLCCRAVGKMMVSQKSGSIINFSTGLANFPMAGMTHYGAAKIGVEHFTKALAKELGPHNVRVNAISPGMTDTPGERTHMSSELIESYAKMIPLGRIGYPEDILGAAMFLASEASDFISGAVISVTGGT